MPTVLACLRRSVERMWPPRVPTRFGPGTRLRRPKNQWNQGPLATPQAEMCPRTANSGLARRAAIYVRQSTPHQVLTNQESLRLQYALRHRARELGWREADIDVIDADLGVSGAGGVHRAGFK